MALGQRSDEIADFLGRVADDTADFDAISKGNDGRNGLNAPLARNVGRMVDVDFGHFDFACIFIGKRFDGGPQCTAGAAPRRPEIDDNRRSTVDHRIKIFVRKVN